ncbi:hypothetical protein MMYC01_200775 [Madurella mycetomatis]|uniref:Uncharacterized protein n=1 Tax=Madurella mycetomatis TaxID=100816 RepID=A0A175WGY3_9PEZI|nr:hypothetical protein MMYC01_200775 [Madurella mycetomatis]
MPPPAEDPKPKLPVTPDVNQIFNRIALGMAKHQRIFDTLAKHRKPTTAAPAQGGRSSGGGGGGFSSLAAPNNSNSSRASNSTTPRNDDADSDLNPAYALPPNAGVGYVPAGANSAATAADGDRAQLRAKVLGRNAARQLELAERGRGGAVQGQKKRGAVRDGESESEEEVGRGAMVRDRGRGARKRNMVLPTAADPAVAARVGPKAESGEDGVKPEGGRKTKRARLVSPPSEPVMGVRGSVSGQEEKAGGGRGGDAVMDDAGAEVAGEECTPLPRDEVEGTAQEQTGSEKKKKKKKKKKKRDKKMKSNDGKGGVEVEAAE